MGATKDETATSREAAPATADWDASRASMRVLVKTPLLYMLPSSMQMHRKEARTTSQDRQFSTVSSSSPPCPPASPFLSSFLFPTSAPSRGCFSALHMVGPFSLNFLFFGFRELCTKCFD